MAGARGTPRRSLVERLFPRRNRHRARDGEVRRAEARAAAVVAARRLAPLGVALGVALVGWPLLREAVRRHPYFAVRAVVVRGTSRLTADEVRAATGIPPGAGIWDVDPAAVEASLRATPWIRTARVERRVPHKVVVSVREHRPLAILAVQAPAPGFFYIARSGRIFAPVGPDDAHDLPYVTGVAADDLRGEGAYGPRAVRTALAVLRRLGRRPGRIGELSEVHVDRVRGLTLVPVRPAVPIELGWTDFELKLARVDRVLADWAGREQEIGLVSCLFDDEVIVRLAVAPTPPAKKKPARPRGA